MYDNTHSPLVLSEPVKALVNMGEVKKPHIFIPGAAASAVYPDSVREVLELAEKLKEN